MVFQLRDGGALAAMTVLTVLSQATWRPLSEDYFQGLNPHLLYELPDPGFGAAETMSLELHAYPDDVPLLSSIQFPPNAPFVPPSSMLVRDPGLLV